MVPAPRPRRQSHAGQVVGCSFQHGAHLFSCESLAALPARRFAQRCAGPATHRSTVCGDDAADAHSACSSKCAAQAGRQAGRLQSTRGSPALHRLRSIRSQSQQTPASHPHPPPTGHPSPQACLPASHLTCPCTHPPTMARSSCNSVMRARSRCSTCTVKRVGWVGCRGLRAPLAREIRAEPRPGKRQGRQGLRQPPHAMPAPQH